MTAARHPYAGQTIGLATIHDKERAIAAPFMRVLGARVMAAPNVDTDTLGTFSGEIARPASPVEVTDMKARMTFETMDVDCSLASEGSYGPIFKVPLKPGGMETLTFIDRKRGVRITQTLTTHRTNWRMLFFKPGEDERVARELKALGFPEYGVVAMQNDDWLTVVKDLATVEDVTAAVNRLARLSADGQAMVIPDMRAHRNPLRMKVIRATAWRAAWSISARNGRRRASAIWIRGAASRARAAAIPPTGSISRSTAARAAAIPSCARAPTAGARRRSCRVRGVGRNSPAS